MSKSSLRARIRTLASSIASRHDPKLTSWLVPLSKRVRSIHRVVANVGVEVHATIETHWVLAQPPPDARIVVPRPKPHELRIRIVNPTRKPERNPVERRRSAAGPRRYTERRVVDAVRDVTGVGDVDGHAGAMPAPALLRGSVRSVRARLGLRARGGPQTPAFARSWGVPPRSCEVLHGWAGAHVWREARGPACLASVSRALHEAQCTRDAASQGEKRHCFSRPAWGQAARDAHAPRRAWCLLCDATRWGRVTEPAREALRPAPRRARGGNMSTSQHRRQLKLAAHAHCMRSAPSEPERVLWHALRAGQLGVRFRRQVVVHGFIVDFFAPAARLVVEVDGAHHARLRGADAR